VVNSVKNRGKLLGKLGVFVATTALPLLLLPGQAAAAGKKVMVEVPSGSSYCQIDVYVGGLARGQKNLCPRGAGVNLSAGWHSIPDVTVNSGDEVSVSYVYYGGSGDSSAGVTVSNDNLSNFWYKYKKTGSFNN
jgi:hypothetical protein